MKKAPSKSKAKTAPKRKPARTKKAASRSSSYKYHLGELYMAIPAAIVIIFLAGYFARGWIRYHAEPTVVSWSADGTNRMLNNEVSDLKDPLARMGITQKHLTRGCNLSYANNFSSTIYCGSAYEGYLSDTRNLMPGLADRAADLEGSLKAQGWNGMNTTVTQLGENISKGIDYTPDAAYMKNVDGGICIIDFNTAFSKPKPPAINGLISCSKNYGIFSSAPKMMLPVPS